MYDNPHYLYEEDGRPMSYIEANRIAEDMFRNPQNYILDFEPELSESEEPF